jgi:hypothetical protein
LVTTNAFAGGEVSPGEVDVPVGEVVEEGAVVGGLALGWCDDPHAARSRVATTESPTSRRSCRAPVTGRLAAGTAKGGVRRPDLAHLPAPTFVGGLTTHLYTTRDVR